MDAPSPQQQLLAARQVPAVAQQPQAVVQQGRALRGACLVGRRYAAIL